MDQKHNYVDDVYNARDLFFIQSINNNNSNDGVLGPKDCKISFCQLILDDPGYHDNARHLSWLFSRKCVGPIFNYTTSYFIHVIIPF